MRKMKWKMHKKHSPRAGPPVRRGHSGGGNGGCRCAMGGQHALDDALRRLLLRLLRLRRRCGPALPFAGPGRGPAVAGQTVVRTLVRTQLCQICRLEYYRFPYGYIHGVSVE